MSKSKDIRAKAKISQELSKFLDDTQATLAQSGRFITATVQLHRLAWVIDSGSTPNDGLAIDHKDGNMLDVRPSNLRLATRTQNNGNSLKRSGTSSRFKGVTFSRRINRWSAKISKGPKTVHLGNFKDETDAARAYDRAAREYFGEFACVNFPEDGERSALVVKEQA